MLSLLSILSFSDNPVIWNPAFYSRSNSSPSILYICNHLFLQQSFPSTIFTLVCHQQSSKIHLLVNSVPSSANSVAVINPIFLSNPHCFCNRLTSCDQDCLGPSGSCNHITHHQSSPASHCAENPAACCLKSRPSILTWQQRSSKSWSSTCRSSVMSCRCHTFQAPVDACWTNKTENN